MKVVKREERKGKMKHVDELHINEPNFKELGVHLDELENYYNAIILECDQNCLNCSGSDYHKDKMTPPANEEIDCVFDAINTIKRKYREAIEIEKMR